MAEAINEVGNLSNHFQLVAEVKNNKDQLIVKVETLDEDIKKYGFSAMELKRAIYEKSKELRALYREGLINDIIIEIVPPGGIERNPRTGKIRLVVDKRSV